MAIILETARLMLTSPTMDDIHQWSILNDMSEKMMQPQLEHYITNYQIYGFSMGSVYLKSANCFIGRAGLFYYYCSDNKKSRDIEMGCELHEDYQNQGYGTELSKALIEFGFKKMYIAKITALTKPNNIHSQYLLEKVGMRYKKKIKVGDELFVLYEIKSDDILYKTFTSAVS